MARRKADVQIGYRAEEEVFRLFPSHPAAAAALGSDRKIVYTWHQGNAPTAIYLQRLHELGADVLYILTGQRAVC